MNQGFLYYFKTSTINKSGDEVKLVKVGMTTDPCNRLYRYGDNDESVKMVNPPDVFERLIAVNDVTLCEAWVLSKLDDKFNEAGREWFLLGNGSIVDTVNRLFDELEKTDGLSPEQQDELMRVRAEKNQEIRDKKRESTQKWREDNRNRDRENSKRWREEHKADEDYIIKHRESAKRWNDENPDRVRENKKRWYNQNKNDEEFMAKKLGQSRQWKKENPDKVREQNRQYNARRRMKKVTSIVMPLVWACANRNGF